MKTKYYGQKISNENQTIYMGEPNINLTLQGGMHTFIACSGNITITSASVIVYLQSSATLQIINAVGAKTYRDGYGIGQIIQTIGISPKQYLGGQWEVLTQDAYFKIVTVGAGDLGGQSDHKIPLKCLTPHTHYQANDTTGNTGEFSPRKTAISVETNPVHIFDYQTMTMSGDGQAYYPSYYGVFAYRRVNINNIE